MRHKQRNYVKTGIGQMVRDIILLAKRYNADISIEKLKRFKPKGRIFNRKVMTIPLALFRRILEARCFDHGIMLNRVDAYHTSKWCSHCGAVGNGHDGSIYSLFRCKECGQVVNADRKASLAVAIKTLVLLKRFLTRNGSRLTPEESLSTGSCIMAPMHLDWRLCINQSWEGASP
ncbi:MAG: zinc ribbon domain-containing protein [Conexivisphaerales archaeon]